MGSLAGCFRAAGAVSGQSRYIDRSRLRTSQARCAGRQPGSVIPGHSMRTSWRGLLGTSLIRLVEDSYPVIAKDLLNPLLELLLLSRDYCSGDIDKFLVLLVVGVRTTEHQQFAGFTKAELMSGDIEVFPGLGTNARSIAASTGIPKETVRRKVAELVEAGWLARDGHNLYFTSRAFVALAPVRESVERLAVRYHDVVAALAREPAVTG